MDEWMIDEVVWSTTSPLASWSLVLAQELVCLMFVCACLRVCASVCACARLHGCVSQRTVCRVFWLRGSRLCSLSPAEPSHQLHGLSVLTYTAAKHFLLAFTSDLTLLSSQTPELRPELPRDIYLSGPWALGTSPGQCPANCSR